MIDDLDNDPAVLLSYLAAAFDRIEPVDDAIRASIAAPRHRILRHRGPPSRVGAPSPGSGRAWSSSTTLTVSSIGLASTPWRC